MPTFTIVTTSAGGGEGAEVSTLVDEFANASEVLGYARRMAEEMFDAADQLSLDFDYSNVAVYEGDRLDDDVAPGDAGFVGLWIFDEEGVVYVPADELDQAPQGEA